MLGLVAIRIWIQCCLYDRYTSTDSGIVTVASNVFRVVVIVVLLVFALRKGFSSRAQTTVGYASIVSMMVSAVLFLSYYQTGTTLFLWAACACAGFGISWGGGMWMCVYVRMQPGEAFLYAFLSLAISSFFGLLVGFLPHSVSYLVAILMPPIALIAYQRAGRILDKRTSEEKAPAYGITDSGHDTIYSKEPKSTFIRLIVGIALFNVALGIARGFPHGESISLPLEFQVIHQLGVVAICAFLLWWTLGKRKSTRFSSLWNMSVGLIAIGVLLLALLDPAIEPFGAALIAIANTFAVGLLWFSVYDISRHSNIPSYIILGVAWAAHILPREIGRFSIWILGPHGTAPILIMALIVLLLAGSMAFLLNDSIPKTRPFFAEFRKGNKSESLKKQVLDAINDEEPATEEPALPIVTSAESLEQSLSSLQDHHYLTDREIEVIRHLAQGRSKSSIGQKLFISENTVKTYVKNIYAKLDIHSKQELLDLIEKA